MKENIREIIKMLEDTYNATSRFAGELVIEMGTMHEGKFDRDFVRVPTHVLIHYKDQLPKFGYMQSIDGDSGYGVILDVTKAVKAFE